jgi:hypothetical protein
VAVAVGPGLVTTGAVAVTALPTLGTDPGVTLGQLEVTLLGTAGGESWVAVTVAGHTVRVPVTVTATPTPPTDSVAGGELVDGAVYVTSTALVPGQDGLTEGSTEYLLAWRAPAGAAVTWTGVYSTLPTVSDTQTTSPGVTSNAATIVGGAATVSADGVAWVIVRAPDPSAASSLHILCHIGGITYVVSL